MGASQNCTLYHWPRLKEISIVYNVGGIRETIEQNYTGKLLTEMYVAVEL